MSEKKTAEKPSWAPNEAPAGRWTGFFFAGLVAMSCAQGLFQCINDLWTMAVVMALDARKCRRV